MQLLAKAKRQTSSGREKRLRKDGQQEHEVCAMYSKRELQMGGMMEGGKHDRSTGLGAL